MQRRARVCTGLGQWLRQANLTEASSLQPRLTGTGFSPEQVMAIADYNGMPVTVALELLTGIRQAVAALATAPTETASVQQIRAAATDYAERRRGGASIRLAPQGGFDIARLPREKLALALRLTEPPRRARNHHHPLRTNRNAMTLTEGLPTNHDRALARLQTSLAHRLRETNNTEASELMVSLGGGKDADRAAARIMATLEQRGEAVDAASMGRGVLMTRTDAAVRVMTTAAGWSTTAKATAIADLRQRATEYDAPASASRAVGAGTGSNPPLTRIADHVTYRGSERLLDLTGKDVRGVADLNAQLQEVRRAYPGVKIDMSRANLSGMQLRNADLRQIVFDGADLSNAQLGLVDLNASRLVNANLSGANLSGARATANFDGANLQGAWLEGTNLTGAGMHRADLRGSSMVEAEMSGADLRDADLRGATLTNANLNGAFLPGANLGFTVLRGANLLRADIQGALAQGASFTGANLNRTDFRGADLSGSDLSKSKLIGTVLTGANLTNVSVTGAVVSDITLTGSQHTDVDWSQIAPSPAPEAPPRTLLDLQRSPRRAEKPIPPRPDPGQPITQIAAFIEVQDGKQVLNLVGKDLRRVLDLTAQVSELRRDFPDARIDLRRARLGGMQLVGIKLQGARLDGADLSRADLTGADLNAAFAWKANFREARMVGATATGNFDGSNFTRALLDRANFTNAGLVGANMDRASLIDAKLGTADMKNANLTGASLRSAVLSGAQLGGATLINADLESASLFKADLTGAHARTVNLTGANLTRAKLDGADLSSARLNRANLTDAKVAGTDLRNARLEGADLTRVDLGGATR